MTKDWTRVFSHIFQVFIFGRDKFNEVKVGAQDNDENEEYEEDYQLVGRAPSRAHVANPIVLQESKLPPELAHLIGQFNDTCETITEEGKYCGMGSESPFIYKVGNTFVDCQSECTGDLCINWLNSLFAGRPTMVDIERKSSSRNESNASNDVVITELSLRLPISYCQFSIPQTKWYIYLPTPHPQSIVPKQLIAPVDPAFLRAGCRILNSGQANVLEVKLGLGPLDPSDILTQGMLQTFSQFDWQNHLLAHFPEFRDLAAGGNYLSDMVGWKVKEEELDMRSIYVFGSDLNSSTSSAAKTYSLNISLPIRELKARKEYLAEINQREQTKRRIAEAVDRAQEGLSSVLRIMENASEEDKLKIAEMIRSIFPQFG